MSSKILFVFEGERREEHIFQSLKKFAFQDREIITCSFGAEIYQLYEQIIADGFLDIFNLIKERDAGLAAFRKDDFAEIYLFFDYDAHTKFLLDGDAKLSEILTLFDNESEHGKLYISYPMVEALWHIKDYDRFHEVIVKCKGANCTFRDKSNDCKDCENEPHYKKIAGQNSSPKLIGAGAKGFDTKMWSDLLKVHLRKMNFVLTGHNDFPEQVSSQTAIFDCQLRKYIDKRCPTVAVLSAFPIFVHDYFGNAKTKELLAIE